MIYVFTEIEKMNYVNGSKYFGKKMEKQFIPSTAYKICWKLEPFVMRFVKIYRVTSLMMKISKILFLFNRKYCNSLVECYNLVIYL